MSKYSHYEMCEKIFGQRYKWNEQKQDYELYSRTDMWNKLIEQQDKITDLEAKLAELREQITILDEENSKTFMKSVNAWRESAELKQKLAESEKFMKDNGFENLEELDNYIQKIHSHYDEVKNKGTCGLCEKLDNELINQLKQQLAEKDAEIEKVEKTYMKQKDYYVKEFNEVIDELKQQLAEKDRQIEQLKKFDDLNKTFFDLFRTAFKEPNKVDDLFNTLKTMQEKQDQDKISFALEQLEKVKEEFISEAWDLYDTSDLLEQVCELRNEQIKFIDNQMEELKKEIK